MEGKPVSDPIYKVNVQKDAVIPMPDGVCLRADIYYPESSGKFPGLLSFTNYGKELQTLTKPREINDWETVARGWAAVEAGNSEYFVSRGYVHVICDPRGSSTSEGAYSFRKEPEDAYHVIEWMAAQPWCNRHVGMLGMSMFAINALRIAALNPPHLKAICPVEALTDFYRHLAYHGGIFCYGFYQYQQPLVHTSEKREKEFTDEEYSRMVEALKANEDIRAYPRLFKILILPQLNPTLFGALMHPYDGPYWTEDSPSSGLEKIKIPTYLMCRWTAWPIHLPGAFIAYEKIKAPKKLRLYTTPSHVAGPQRPWNENHEHVLRWYDYWLKGIDTGMTKEPPIQIFVQGINQWRDEYEWPLARTRWTPYYLRSGGLLCETPPIQSEPPDRFLNNPWLKVGEEVPCIKYTSPPLARDMEITGPIALYFHASSASDANWMVDIKDIDPNGEERLVSKGWLKASHRELDGTRSKPYQPYHPHARSLPVEPGKIYEYAMEVRETSNVFRAGHGIQLVIKGQDSRSEEGDHYNHLNNMTETWHSIYHSDEYPSYLLLPMIPIIG